MLTAAKNEVYTDLNGLADLKSAARRNDPDAIKEVAKQFESVFLTMMLKSMRQAKLGEGILDSDQSRFFQDMYDQQLALHLSGDPGIGLADLIAKQLSPATPNTMDKQGLGDYLDHPLFDRMAQTPTRLPEPVAVERMLNKSAPAMEDVKKSTVQPITSKAQFVQQLRPYAERAAARLGVDPNILLAQAALETGWGKAVIKQANGQTSFNLFNIKADARWEGKQASTQTLEFEEGIGRRQTAKFRVYQSYADSFEDYVDFIQRNPRYQDALKVVAKPERYMHELQQAGYATDPEYAHKVMRVFQDETIQQSAILAMN